jgi:branched-subunit amino acid ABC-type transport system permease component
LAIVPLVAPPSARSEEVTSVPSRWPFIAAVVCGVGTIFLSAIAGTLIGAAKSSAQASPIVLTASQAAVPTASTH